MKSKILFYIAVGLAFLTVSCDSYLDKEPDDMQTIEGVFAKRSTTEQYLANAYAYLPEQYDAVDAYATSQVGTHCTISPSSPTTKLLLACVM